MGAADDGKLDTVKKLISEGANVNASLVSKNYLTPLFCAADSWTAQHLQIGKLLLESGAKVNPENTYLTALYVAAEQDTEYSEEFIKMLIAAGADINECYSGCGGPCCVIEAPIFQALKNRNFIGKIKILVEVGANVNAGNHEENTPLHILVKKVIKLAVEVEREEFFGRPDKTDYLEAMKGIDLLVAAGADKNAKNEDKQTPIGYVRDHFYYHYDSRMDKAIEKIKERLGV